MMGLLNPLKNNLKRPSLKKGYYLVLLLFLATPKFAHANFFLDAIERAVLEMGFFLIGGAVSILFFIINSVIYTAVWLARYIAEMAISLSLSMPYTSGDVFNAGWPVMRDLANMGLILILVGIGVGTMLNLKLNKDRLAMFFLVALLINFTNVITGIVIDFSNIIGSVFFNAAQNSLSALIGVSPFDVALQAGRETAQTLETLGSAEEFASGMIGLIAGPLITSVLGIILFFVFMLLTALFIGRILALMLLVILSPVAFLGLIWSSGKMRQLWNKWWDTFLQWALIAVPMLFFLWLAGIFLNEGAGYCTASLPSGAEPIEEAIGLGVLDSEGGFVCRSMQSFLAIGALITGVVMSFKTSAAGSKMIISRAQRFQKWGTSKVRQAATAPGRAAGRVVKRESARTVGAAGTRIAGSKAAKVPVMGGAFRSAGRRLQGFEGKQRTEWRKHEKDYTGMTWDQLQAHIKTEKDPDKLAAIMNLAGRNHADDLDSAIRNNTIDDKKIKSYLNMAQFRTTEKGENLQDAWIKNNPHHLKKHLGKTDTDVRTKTERLSANDLYNLTLSAINERHVVEGVIKNDDAKVKQLRHVINKVSKTNNTAMSTNLKTNLKNAIIGSFNTLGPNSSTQNILTELDNAGGRWKELKNALENDPDFAGIL
ncbi:MAG: hypothetical protein WDZ40_04370 [Candidatus Spechtbacterales bacterium]